MRLLRKPPRRATATISGTRQGQQVLAHLAMFSDSQDNWVHLAQLDYLDHHNARRDPIEIRLSTPAGDLSEQPLRLALADVRPLCTVAQDIEHPRTAQPGQFTASVIAQDLAALVLTVPVSRIIAIDPASLITVTNGLQVILTGLGLRH